MLWKIIIFLSSGCFFHLRQNVYKRVQQQGLTNRYQADNDFALKIKMLGSLAFVPENDVISCFNTLMEDFPEEAIEIAKYFENT